MEDTAFFIFTGISPELLDRVAVRLLDSGIVDTVGATAYSEDERRHLSKESEVTYDPLYCAQDIHQRVGDTTVDEDRLAILREQYGMPFLTPYKLVDAAYAEVSEETGRKLIQGWFDFYSSVFDDIEPELLMTNMIDGCYAMVPYCIAMNQPTRALWVTETRVRARHTLIEDDVFGNLPSVRARFRAFEHGYDSPTAHPDAKAAATEYLASFREKSERPAYFDRRTSSYHTSPVRSLVHDFQRLRRVVSDGVGSDKIFHENYEFPSRRTLTKRVLSDGLARSRTVNNDLFEKPAFDANYVYFPLHVDGEPSTRKLAPMYENQETLVEQVARSLPLSHELVVKEHPRMFRDKPRSFRSYRRLAELSGVRLVNPGVDSQALTQHADAVVTITGTPAFEASILGTPAITFGSAHFNALSFVYQCRSPPSLATVFDRVLTEYEHDEDELRNYLTALFVESFEAPGDIWGLDETAADAFAEKIFDRI